jgi:1,4-alpha-glucan branching enzyme
VVHGKGSLLDKMPGDDWQQFANLRAYLAFMWGHPGKKLLFMGQEFAQREEWAEGKSLDWYLLDSTMHEGMRRLVADLNLAYRELPALHARDNEPDGFEWVIGNDHANSVFAWLQHDADTAQWLQGADAAGRQMGRADQYRCRLVRRQQHGQPGCGDGTCRRGPALAGGSRDLPAAAVDPVLEIRAGITRLTTEIRPG